MEENFMAVSHLKIVTVAAISNTNLKILSGKGDPVTPHLKHI